MNCRVLFELGLKHLLYVPFIRLALLSDHGVGELGLQNFNILLDGGQLASGLLLLPEDLFAYLIDLSLHLSMTSFDRLILLRAHRLHNALGLLHHGVVLIQQLLVVFGQVFEEGRRDTDGHGLKLRFSRLIGFDEVIQHLLVPLGFVQVQFDSLQLKSDGLLVGALDHDEFGGGLDLVVDTCHLLLAFIKTRLHGFQVFTLSFELLINDPCLFGELFEMRQIFHVPMEPGIGFGDLLALLLDLSMVYSHRLPKGCDEFRSLHSFHVVIPCLSKLGEVLRLLLLTLAKRLVLRLLSCRWTEQTCSLS